MHAPGLELRLCQKVVIFGGVGKKNAHHGSLPNGLALSCAPTASRKRRRPMRVSSNAVLGGPLDQATGDVLVK
jgi:hypothetical protein